MKKIKRSLASKLKEKEYERVWTDFKPHLYYKLPENFRIKKLAGTTIQCVERLEKEGKLTDKYKVRIIGIGKFALGKKIGIWRARKILVVNSKEIESYKRGK